MRVAFCRRTYLRRRGVVRVAAVVQVVYEFTDRQLDFAKQRACLFTAYDICKGGCLRKGRHLVARCKVWHIAEPHLLLCNAVRVVLVSGVLVKVLFGGVYK